MIRLPFHVGGRGDGGGGEGDGMGVHRGMQETKLRARECMGRVAYPYISRVWVRGAKEEAPITSSSCMGRKTSDSGTCPSHIPTFVRQADSYP